MQPVGPARLALCARRFVQRVEERERRAAGLLSLNPRGLLTQLRPGTEPRH